MRGHRERMITFLPLTFEFATLQAGLGVGHGLGRGVTTRGP